MTQNILNEPALESSTIEEDVEPTLMERFSYLSPYIALLVAWVATCGSLFFSEVLLWMPCALCWYQRILMYPLAIIIAVGILRRDNRMYWYVLPFTALGGAIALYHYLLVKTTWFEPPKCTTGIPCTIEYLNWFGFINIPLMALTAFILISAMMLFLMSFPAFESTESDYADDVASARPSLRTFGAVVGIIGLVIVSFVILAQVR